MTVRTSKFIPTDIKPVSDSVITKVDVDFISSVLL